MNDGVVEDSLDIVTAKAAFATLNVSKPERVGRMLEIATTLGLDIVFDAVDA